MGDGETRTGRKEWRARGTIHRFRATISRIDPGPAAQIFLGKHIQYIYINTYKYSIVLT